MDLQKHVRRVGFKFPTISLDKLAFRDFDFRDEQLIYEVVCAAEVQETEMDGDGFAL